MPPLKEMLVPFNGTHIHIKSVQLVFTDITFCVRTPLVKFRDFLLPGLDVDHGTNNHDLLAFEEVHEQGQGCKCFSETHVVCETHAI